jgi:hypothetical protein
MIESSNKPSGERAPLLLIFGSHAGRMTALMRERPNLTARLIMAPREALHAIGAFLHLAPAAIQPDADVAAIIHDADPCDLLSAALPGCPARLFKALDRVGDRIHERSFYERLGLISRSPFADALHDGDFRLPRNAGMASLARRLQRALGRIPAPDPGFSPPAPYRIVTSTADLQRIGKKFGNCVAMPNYHAVGYHFRLVGGTGVFLVSDDPALLVALRRVGGWLWVLEQMMGPKNQAPSRGSQAALLRDLAAAGLKIVTIDPQAAYARLHDESRSRRALADLGEDDVDDDQDDGIDVAIEEVAA